MSIFFKGKNFGVPGWARHIKTSNSAELKKDGVDCTNVEDSLYALSQNDSNVVSSISGSQVYDSSKSYTVGQYCISDNVLYQCIVNCSGVVPPNDTYWKKVDLATLNNNFTNLSGLKLTHFGQFLSGEDNWCHIPITSIYDGTYLVKAYHRNTNEYSTYGILTKLDKATLFYGNGLETFADTIEIGLHGWYSFVDLYKVEIS